MTGKSAGDNLNECVLAGIVVRSWQWCLLGMGLIATQQPASVYKPPSLVYCCVGQWPHYHTYRIIPT